jgi:hypothetical protein
LVKRGPRDLKKRPFRAEQRQSRAHPAVDDMEIAGEHGMMQQRDERYDQQQRESHEEHDLGSFDFE